MNHTFSLPNMLSLLCLVVAGALSPGWLQAQAINEDWQLVWSDEFEYEGLPDSTKWSYDVGDGCPDVCGWGNNELQYYTKGRPENARVENGILVVEAHREPMGGKDYSSARLISREKGDWIYGYVEVRAKLPEGRGTWPAIWMLPTDWDYGDWPKSGEIDIMEHVGYDPFQVHGTVHTEAYNHGIGTQRGKQHTVATLFDDYHLYAMRWTPEKIEFMIDGEVFNTFENEESGFEAWPFDKRFYLLLNVAVGGNWGDKMGVAEHIWPQRMEVDYVRVYQRPFLEDHQ